MNKRNLFFLAFCFLIGFGFVVQERLTEGQMLYVSAKAVSDYKTTIRSEKQEVEKLNDLISQEKRDLALYEGESTGNPEMLTEKLQSELRLYQMYSAAVDLKGPGVIITIDDGTRDLYEGEDINNLLVHDADLLMVINDLKKNGAEAIAVNGQRLADSTSIICSGYTVEINGERYARPFIIKAIGAGNRMASSLIGPEGYGTSLKDWGVLFQIELSDEIIIPAYKQEKAYRYTTKVKEVGKV